ncbi:MAG: hypothetical protein ACP5XB_19585 [Isosphaeraceae bacterium]
MAEDDVAENQTASAGPLTKASPEFVLPPKPIQEISTQDAQPTETSEEDVAPSGGMSFSADTTGRRQIQVQVSRETHVGPLPHPAYVREMADIYPDAPRMIFAEFQEQGSHRRKIENLVIQNRIQLSIRG